MAKASFEVGDKVFVQKLGVGTIRERRTAPRSQLVVSLEHGDVGIDEQDAEFLLRAIISRQEAVGLLDELCAPAPSRGDLPPLRSARAFLRMPPAEQCPYVRLLYRNPSLLAGNERDIVVGHEALLVQEIVAALAGRPDAVRDALREGKPEIADRRRKTASRVLPSVRGYAPLGIFTTSESMTLGDPAHWASPARPPRPSKTGEPALTLTAEPGTWFAYVKPSRDGDAEVLFAVHASQASRIAAVRKSRKPVGSLRIDSGRVALTDTDALDDEAWCASMQGRGSIEDGTLGERGCVTRCGGDGSYTVHAAVKSDKVVLVLVDFR